MPTIAVGAIASYDDVNTIVLAGRADMCALARPHLYDPHWTLHAAAEQEYAGDGVEWVPQYQAGSRKPPTGRADDVRKELAALLRARPARGAHRPRGLVLGDSPRSDCASLGTILDRRRGQREALGHALDVGGKDRSGAHAA